MPRGSAAPQTFMQGFQQQAPLADSGVAPQQTPGISQVQQPDQPTVVQQPGATQPTQEFDFQGRTMSGDDITNARIQAQQDIEDQAAQREVDRDVRAQAATGREEEAAERIRTVIDGEAAAVQQGALLEEFGDFLTDPDYESNILVSNSTVLGARSLAEAVGIDTEASWWGDLTTIERANTINDRLLPTLLETLSGNPSDADMAAYERAINNRSTSPEAQAYSNAVGRALSERIQAEAELLSDLRLEYDTDTEVEQAFRDRFDELPSIAERAEEIQTDILRQRHHNTVARTVGRAIDQPELTGDELSEQLSSEMEGLPDDQQEVIRNGQGAILSNNGFAFIWNPELEGWEIYTRPDESTNTPRGSGQQRRSQ